MRFIRIFLLAVCGCGIPAAAAAQVTVFENVTVLPMDSERTLANQTVVVRGERIETVGPAGSVRIPAGAVRIDGRGKFLTPGLAEMHAHIPGASAPAQLVEDVLSLYVANGITTIRGMLGAPNQLELRERAQRNEIASPFIIVGAPSLSGQSAATPAAAMALVQKNAEAGYDFQKIHPGFNRETFDSAWAVAQRNKLKFAGHVPVDVGLARALEIRQDIDHLDGYLEAAVPEAILARIVHPTETITFGEVFAAIDESRIPELVRMTKDAGIYNAPTMYLWENFFGAVNADSLVALPEMQYVPKQWLQNWLNQKGQRVQQDLQNGIGPAERQKLFSFRRNLLKALADAGAWVLMGTDSPQMFNVPGFALHHEIRVMSEAGLTPYQVLQSGTANVGRYAREVLGLQDRFGTIAPGMRADLVLLDANPLTDIVNLARRSGVMVRGRWFSAEELNLRLQQIAARNAS